MVKVIEVLGGDISISDLSYKQARERINACSKSEVEVYFEPCVIIKRKENSHG